MIVYLAQFGYEREGETTLGVFLTEQEARQALDHPNFIATDYTQIAVYTVGKSTNCDRIIPITDRGEPCLKS